MGREIEAVFAKIRLMEQSGWHFMMSFGKIYHHETELPLIECQFTKPGLHVVIVQRGYWFEETMAEAANRAEEMAKRAC